MNGLFIALSTLAAFGLMGWGIYYAIGQIALHFDAMQDADDFGDVHSEVQS